MLFNSYTFILFFLPLTWLCFIIARRVLPAGSNVVLVLASLFFYAWWDVRFLPLLLASILVNFWLGRRIVAANNRRDVQAAKRTMVLGIVLNLATLGFFKYVDFFLENAAAVIGSEPSLLGVILPIGISFFTFQQISYLVDVRQGRSDNYGLVDYALFVSFFPQLIAGPIVHHREMMPQFMRKRGVQAQDLAVGVTIFLAGLFKKVVIADSIAPFSTGVFNAADAGLAVTSLEAWGAAMAYTMQIYFDFSGYSDMAIGLARMFGIRLPLNFNSPYKATSIIDFWRRWHMTLSRFLRDYLYIPLGGNRKGPMRRHLNLFVTMLLGGIWHGAGWGFVIWGALHGSYLAINHAMRALALPDTALIRFAGWFVTFIAVVFAWVFFRATTLDGALGMSSAMLGIGGFSVPDTYADVLGSAPLQIGLVYQHTAIFYLSDWALTGVPLIVLAVLLATTMPNTSQIILGEDAAYRESYGASLKPVSWKLFQWRPGIGQAMVVLGFGCAALVTISTLSEFLYFQF